MRRCFRADKSHLLKCYGEVGGKVNDFNPFTVAPGPVTTNDNLALITQESGEHGKSGTLAMTMRRKPEKGLKMELK